MATWERSTPWRQAQFLGPDALAAFGIATGEQGADAACAVVISHDCDLAQPVGTEPDVEVIVGRLISASPEGNFANAKNLRRLHLPCHGMHATVELEATRRRNIPKEGAPGLADFAPATQWTLAARERDVLQRWLASRYRRAAFPDEFDRRLGTETKLAESLSRALKATSDHVVAVFFNVQDPERERMGQQDPYELEVTLVYDTSRDPQTASEAASQAGKAVEKAFRGKCCVMLGEVETWRWFELVGPVAVVSDHALTYAQSLTWTKWQADHLSFRSEPMGPVLD